MIMTLQQAFGGAFAGFAEGHPILLLAHNDADGLAAAALFARTFDRIGRPCRTRILGSGENPWSAAVRAEFADDDFGGLIVTDLGVRDGDVLPGVPTIIVDHHVPTGMPGAATVFSGYGREPTPTSSLLAYQCVGALAEVDDLLWLAAVGLVGDLGDKAPFPELEAAKTRYTAAALKEAVALVNAPRRTASGNADAPLALLMHANDPKDAISGRRPETGVLRLAREEVKAALEVGKRVAPRVAGTVALILLDSPCQIHPLVAQAWRMRLKDRIVIAANTGYRSGWVHFAARSATGRDLIDFLREVAPPNADENYGSGHREATGGALRTADWPVFLGNIGFDAGGRPLANRAAA